MFFGKQKELREQLAHCQEMLQAAERENEGLWNRLKENNHRAARQEVFCKKCVHGVTDAYEGVACEFNCGCTNFKRKAE